MTLRSIRNVTLLLGAAFASGCTVFPNPEPPRIMDLAVVQVVPEAEQPIMASLRVDTPYASEPFNGSRILAKPTPHEFRAYEGTRWRDTAPVVVRDTLVTSLRNSNAYTNVITDTNPAQAELSLVTELSAFHSETPAKGPQVVIELHLQMIHNRSRARLCTHIVRIVEPASGTSVDQIVEAFGTAGSKLAARVIDWATTCDYPSGLMPSQGTDQPRQP
ncbi:cholesterol transport system auxiliary component [Marinobacter sp. es.048]|uniref:ABC-type transport auxiliary lipoprotein family protein n=1 Tax=Marinobacter sp. es.048 TaxID=1761795 RepID=UPI000B72DA40|nr:ABC-type transport auxiliary lipoprotein family protein [Marinobacter sp. es.048]SNC74831.1 cholesterol transport system auxiliary component [Marinobacter sp. es.048]